MTSSTTQLLHLVILLIDKKVFPQPFLSMSGAMRDTEILPWTARNKGISCANKILSAQGGTFDSLIPTFTLPMEKLCV